MNNELFKIKDFSLIVSIPENSLAYATSAAKNGADAVKLHANVKHRVTGKLHETWDEVKPAAKTISEKIDVPIGIVPGSETMATENEINEMFDVGLSFFDVYIEYAPLYLLKNKMHKMLALNYTFDLSFTPYIKNLKPDSLEISIINPDSYGERLTADDLLKYSKIIEDNVCPAFVPTQKNIMPEEIQFLYDIGVYGIIIGPVVTGTDMDQFSHNVKKYKKAIQNLRR
ncbi:MAG: hypothetical protein ACOC80_08865 [Petrotogales bacterium]